MSNAKRKVSSVEGLLKRMVSSMTAMVKAKTLSLKSKTQALRTRLIIFSLLRNKKILMMGSLSDKLRNLALMGKQQLHHLHHHKKHEEDDEDEEETEHEQEEQSRQAIVMYNYNHSVPATSARSSTTPLRHEVDGDLNIESWFCNKEEEEEEEEEDDDKYPDLRHGLFEELEEAGGSVIDLVKKSKKEGEEFRLEDEINEVADLFIQKFHRQMRMQKQLSFKRKRQQQQQQQQSHHSSSSSSSSVAENMLR